MVDFNKISAKDLSVGDQFRLAVGEVIADAMKAAMMLVQSGALNSLSHNKRAEVLTAMTIPSVYKIEGVIEEFAKRKEAE